MTLKRPSQVARPESFERTLRRCSNLSRYFSHMSALARDARNPHEYRPYPYRYDIRSYVVDSSLVDDFESVGRGLESLVLSFKKTFQGQQWHAYSSNSGATLI
jgi:hypothetical protein